MTEATLLTLENIGEGFEFLARGTGVAGAIRADIAGDEDIDGLLEHAFLILQDDIGCAEFHKLPETVVSVDDAAVEIIEITGRVASTVELDHGAQIGRQYLEDVEHEMLGSLTRLEEARRELELLEDLFMLGLRTVLELFLLLTNKRLEVDTLEKHLDILRSRTPLEDMGKLLVERTIVKLADNLADDNILEERLEALVLDIETIKVCRKTNLYIRELFFVDFLGFELETCLTDDLLCIFLELGFSRLVGILKLAQRLLALILEDIREEVRREIDDLFKFLDRYIEEESYAGRDGLQVPDVDDGCSELDMTRALATYLCGRDLDSAALTDDAFVPDTLVLATGTLEVLTWTEYLLTEESAALRALGSVVDRLGDEDFTVGDRADLILRRDTDGDAGKVVEIFPFGDITFASVEADLLVVLLGELVVEEVLKISVSKHGAGG